MPPWKGLQYDRSEGEREKDAENEKERVYMLSCLRKYKWGMILSGYFFFLFSNQCNNIFYININSFFFFSYVLFKVYFKSLDGGENDI